MGLQSLAPPCEVAPGMRILGCRTRATRRVMGTHRKAPLTVRRPEVPKLREVSFLTFPAPGGPRCSLTRVHLSAPGYAAFLSTHVCPSVSSEDTCHRV